MIVIWSSSICVTSSRRTVISGSRGDSLGDSGGENRAVDRQRMAGRDSAFARDLQQQRSRPPHFFFQQPGRCVLAVGFQRVRANQFREIRGLMRRRRTHGTHLPEFDRDAAARALPRRFRSGKAGADRRERCWSSCVASVHLGGALQPDASKRIAVQADGLPLIQKSRAQAPVKIDCRSVPVEHLPAHAKAILLPRDGRDPRQQSLSNSLPRYCSRT